MYNIEKAHAEYNNTDYGKTYIRKQNYVDQIEECTKPNYIQGYDQYIQIKSDHDTIDKKYDYTGSNGINYTWSDVLGLRLWNKWFRNSLIQVNNWGSAQDISKIIFLDWSS